MTKVEFWSWFKDHRTAIENFVLGKDDDYMIYEKLSEQLNEYSEFLIPELTQTGNNQFVLVISCDGVKEGIPFVEELVTDVQPFENWIIEKYRQPGPLELIPFKGLNLKRRRIFLTWSRNVSKNYVVTFYIRGYTKRDSRYQAATILHLDHTIGEYNAMTRIDRVFFKKLGLFQSSKNFRTLDDLRAELDKTSSNI